MKLFAATGGAGIADGFEMIARLKKLATYTCVAALMTSTMADACTRATYVGPQGTIITARSMDWTEDMDTDLWIFPRGLQREGGTGANTVRWKSKYGSVAASVYESGTADGMNERGLVANLLYLAESDFGPEDSRPSLSIGAWPQYVLDNFATVAEAVEALKGDAFRIVAPELPNGKKSSLHMSISDSSGDSAIFEYIGGKLRIHHSRDYQVMTNSPVFEQQLALDAYWRQIGGNVMLPGTIRAADRFVRASYFTKAVPQTSDIRTALASMFGVIRNASVPYGISTPGAPNLASTIWRVVADQKSLTYYYEDALSPNVIWVKLSDMNLSEGQPVLRAGLNKSKDAIGSIASRFSPAQPFPFRLSF